MDPGQRIRDSSGRNTPEVTGTWKQYSGRKISGFFPVNSDHFPVLSRQKLVGNNRKKSGNFPAGTLLPCSDDFRCIPAGSSVFSVSFLQVPSGSGHRNLRPGDKWSLSSYSCKRRLKQCELLWINGMIKVSNVDLFNRDDEIVVVFAIGISK